MTTKLTSEEHAAYHLQIIRCLGNTARGNHAPGCHPNEMPGRYHVRFGMCILNANLMSFEAAKSELLMMHMMLSRVLEMDRKGGPGEIPKGRLPDLENLREVDHYGGHDSWLDAEKYLKDWQRKNRGPHRTLWDNPTQGRYGWVHQTRLGGKTHGSLLVVPVSGVVHELPRIPRGGTFLDVLDQFGSEHPELPVVYTV